MKQQIENILEDCILGNRLSVEESILLFEHSSLSQLGYYADLIRKKKNNLSTYFVRNYHIEPTNVCVFQCKFCAFSVADKKQGWSKSHDEIIAEVSQLAHEVRELHIVGGSNPEFNLGFYANLLLSIKNIRPDIHIKAFTAAEINYLAQLEATDIQNILNTLKTNGLNSLPGGGAEIFDDTIRNQICPDKVNAKQWLTIHQCAHQMGLKSNATMLYGHLESLRQRFSHMEMLRNLQDETGGFQAFIPLKYRNKNNALKNIEETQIIEDLKMFAISRLFFDNIDHLKIYWPAFGKQFAMLTLSFGADDLDGTIQNSTRIYSMAGAAEDTHEMTEDEARVLIINSGYIPVERDALYMPVV